jgi:hypothetical protein
VASFCSRCSALDASEAYIPAKSIVRLAYRSVSEKAELLTS